MRWSIALGLKFQWDNRQPVVRRTVPVTGRHDDDMITTLKLGTDFRCIKSCRSGIIGLNKRPGTPRQRRFVEIPNAMRARVWHLPAASRIVPSDHEVSSLGGKIDRSGHPEPARCDQKLLRLPHIRCPRSRLHSVPADVIFPILAAQQCKLRSRHAPQDHVVPAVPESVIRCRINIFTRIIDSALSVSISILNKVWGRKTPPWKHRFS